MNKLICLVTAAVLMTAITQAEPAPLTGAYKPGNEEVALTVPRISPKGQPSETKTFVDRRSIAAKAETYLRKAGVNSDKAIIAVLANAWHECKWNPAGKSGSNIGFFQLNRAGGMGRGHSVAKLQQLEYNIAVMTASTSFKDWVKWANKNPETSAGKMAYRFAAKVERCTSSNWDDRQRTADRWYKALKPA
ncbi:MAG: hypothetical protein JSS66_08000 [Armatimonadetes bacterium]|nr:hypothetical protein [Armatimonadota bacterium]